MCTVWSEFTCAFVSSRGFKARFTADFVEHLYRCVDRRGTVLEGMARLPRETHLAVLFLALVSRSLDFPTFVLTPVLLGWTGQTVPCPR